MFETLQAMIQMLAEVGKKSDLQFFEKASEM
jgi:hypothetical protein